MSNELPSHIALKTFHADSGGVLKEKMSDIPVDHIKNGSIREYYDKHSACMDKSMVVCGHFKYQIAMSKTALKEVLSEKLNMKFI